MFIQHYGTFQLNKIDRPPVPDSVSVDKTVMEFDGTGSSLDDNVATVTSSGGWAATRINTGDGTLWFHTAPLTGISGDTCTVTCDASAGALRWGHVRFTVGIATVDISIHQIGNV